MAFFKVLVIAATLVSSTLADFHIIIEDTAIAAIPSNKYSCRSLGDGGHQTKNAALRGAPMSGFGVPQVFFQMRGALCGASTVNFYPQPDGTIQAFIDQGDGSLLATCYNNSRKDTVRCSDGTNWSETHVCYSYLCN